MFWLAWLIFSTVPLSSTNTKALVLSTFFIAGGSTAHVGDIHSRIDNRSKEERSRRMANASGVRKALNLNYLEEGKSLIEIGFLAKCRSPNPHNFLDAGNKPRTGAPGLPQSACGGYPSVAITGAP
jgi:hypothetical protein